MLTDEQVVGLTGRARNETEPLRHEDHLLKKEIERLQARLAALEAAQEEG